MAGLFSWLIRRGLPLVPKPIVGRVARRYVAGPTLDDALRKIEELAAEGAMATLDLLGEEVKERSKAVASTDEYVRMLDAIGERGLNANISVKPTAVGLKIDRSFCLENFERIASSARDHGNFVRLDMEDATTTDATLDVYRTLQPRYGNLGIVLQAYMRRTLADIAALPDDRTNVRLCKGIYVEPREIAFKAYETVRLNFLAALEKLFASGIYTGVATHDEHLACGALALIDRYRVPRERYEFQMLLGVEPALRKILLEGGHRLRVYVPYGKDWYPYSTRRLRENPEVAKNVLRSMFGGG